jgi:mannose-1-phosphate guanylyltransferase
MRKITPVILSGGSGTRLWPMSRPELPKQFLALTSEETMLQLTARRTSGAGYAAPIVVANTAHLPAVMAQLSEIGSVPDAIILEPVARNTAPAIALAALIAGSDDTPLLVMPSDHVIDDTSAFHAAITQALPLVEQGWLVTFGITPDAPETGYGWIKVGEPISQDTFRVAQFIEKPPLPMAQAMLEAGDHVWNGGIFMFRADRYLDALGRFAPSILSAARAAIESAVIDGTCIYPEANFFAGSPADSIDYAVMERAEQVAVIPVAIGWNDVGSWDALHAISPSDTSENVVRGDVTIVDSSGCLVRTNEMRVSMIGVHDLIVVVSGGDIMILPRGRSQDVKKLIESRV